MKNSLLNNGLLATAVTGSLLVAPVTVDAQPTPAGTARFGVNLAGAEFGGTVPGTYDRDYTYPGLAVMDYYRAKGRTLFRLPFRWERMQRSLNSALDTAELERLRATLRAAGERGLHIILDVHAYGRYQFAGDDHTKSHIIGSERVPYAAFADLWAKLAAAVKDEPAVYAYGLMNEPHDMEDETRWPRAAQAAIDAIRRVDGKTIIMVAGDNWSSSRGWRSGPNETLNQKVRDPQNNLVFEAHCYFDKDNSGSYKKNYDEEGGSPNGGIEYVGPFVEWCRAKGMRGFVGEYGVPHTDARWLVTMDPFLGFLKQNNIGAAYWAGGPWWGNYPLAIEPQDARTPAQQATGAKTGTTVPEGGQPEVADRPQMLILRQYPG